MLALQRRRRGCRCGVRVSQPRCCARRAVGRRRDRGRRRDPMTLAALLVNAAGLDAPAIAPDIEGMPIDRFPTPISPRATTSAAARRRRSPRLIYPVPEPGGLGVHLTLDMAARRASAPMSSGSTASTMRSIRRAPTGSIRRSANTGRHCRTAPDAELFGIAAEDRAAGRRLAGFPDSGAEDHGVDGLINLFVSNRPG